jgi:diguanylate cyclase (GGDEF)-like protein
MVRGGGVPRQQTRACANCGDRASHPTRDELTGLASRASVMHYLQGLLANRMARHIDSGCPPEGCRCFDGHEVAVLFCDIDRFRVVNESLGRDAGDLLLRVAAGRLQSTVTYECGDSAMVGRVASDEFVVVCNGMSDPDAAMSLAGRIHGAFSEPVSLGEDRIKARLSVGIALAGPGTDGADSLLRHAEAAAARAKAEGKDRIETFDADMLARSQQRLRTELDLAGACHRGEMRLHYQPIFHLGEQRITGLEALVRWQHPERGLVPPDEFIPLAEETGLIRQIGDWVMEEGWTQGRDWNLAGCRVNVGVNVSARQLSQDGFVDSVGALIDRLSPGVGPHMEITESVLMADPVESAAKLRALRDLGVRLSLDDFGTGYSSLAYLQRFPVHILKIDRSFIAAIDQDSRQRALVEAMVRLGHALDLLVLAEGLETPAERTVLEDLGVDLLQGYLIAKPTLAELLPTPDFL